MKRKFLFLLAFLCIAVCVRAQDKDESDTTYNTDVIEVYDEYRGINLKETPGSIDVINKRDFSRNNGIHLMNTINTIPGVKMEMRTATAGTRILIRGYGTQTNFNGFGYKAYLNNISLTDADGTTILDDIDFTILGKVEVIKGPMSSLYGMGIGGVVNMQTERAPQGTTVRQDFLTGRYDLYRTNTIIGMGTSKTNLFVDYGYQYYKSFRIHNSSRKSFLTVNGDVYSDANRRISLFVNYTASNDELAGQVDSLQFISVPDTAEVPYLRNNAHINIESTRLGFAHDYQFSNVFSNNTSLFTGGFVQDQPFAAGLNRTNKVRFGGRTSFIYKPMLGKIASRFIFGVEFLKNINYNKSYALSNGVLGAMRSDFEIKPMTYNGFLQTEFNFTKSTLFILGGSINFIEYGITDNIAASPTHFNASGYKVFDPIFTPRVSVNQKLTENISAYATFSQGYAPPGTGQVVIAEIGQVNTELKPEIATNYEVGTKGSLLKEALNYQIAAYQMDVKDKLVPQIIAATGSTPQYTITTNAGEVRYRGAEAFISYDWFGNTRGFLSHLRPYVSYTYTDAENIDFKSDNTNNANTKDYSGLKVSGVPPHLLTAGLDVESNAGAYLFATYSYTAEYPIVLDNSHIAEAYGLLSAKLGFKKQVSNKWLLDVYAGSDNITSEKYPTMVFLNLTAPQGQLAKFFNPGPKITYYGGFSLRYLF
jgi:iron complex outermembrane receptor protein